MASIHHAGSAGLRLLLRRLGALPAPRVIWSLLLVFSVWVVLDVFFLHLTSGLAPSSFDAMIRHRVLAAAPDSRIVIVDIDESSLARLGPEFGRWPWPRDTLATTLNHIERQQPAAIVWDVVFSDPDKLNPGGDAAFDEAVRLSPHSHFSVVRLPATNDAQSVLTAAHLPGLWSQRQQTAKPTPTALPSTVAMIPPALPAIAAARLGFNNGHVDHDGVLRRYRYAEVLPDGSLIHSLPLSVLQALDRTAYDAAVDRALKAGANQDELIAWRGQAAAYPRVPFADVFAVAEGAKPTSPILQFAGKVVIIGSTAPSLHDIHPTPLSVSQAGVETLATAIDNALNLRHIKEVPLRLQAALAITLCTGLAIWGTMASLTALAPALFVLPLSLVGISYLSLNDSPFFFDLHLPAGLALFFLALLRIWNSLRRNYWCAPPDVVAGPYAITCWEQKAAWTDASVEQLIHAVERLSPTCRIIVGDTSVSWPAVLRWPELNRFASVVGPQVDLETTQKALSAHLESLGLRCGPVTPIIGPPDRHNLAKHALLAQWRLSDKNEQPGEAIT
jgi:CHASE2 domain-containing sensor protein